MQPHENRYLPLLARDLTQPVCPFIRVCTAHTHSSTTAAPWPPVIVMVTMQVMTHPLHLPHSSCQRHWCSSLACRSQPYNCNRSKAQPTQAHKLCCQAPLAHPTCWLKASVSGRSAVISLAASPQNSTGSGGFTFTSVTLVLMPRCRENTGPPATSIRLHCSWGPDSSPCKQQTANQGHHKWNATPGQQLYATSCKPICMVAVAGQDVRLAAA